MKPSLRIATTLLMILVLSFIFSCEKIPFLKENYRKQYCGNFSFTMITANWRMDTGTWYDTTYTEGVVRLYEPGDSDTDLYSQEESGMDDDKRITIIVVGDNPFITPMIDENGLFSPLSGYHYHHEGLFSDPDHLNFS
ncbi:MAG TPA: hypothetical protein P5338_09700, partial [Bacteroidales bacterium]|nr:hypothetical protein [Bacteroidales bacterium]